MHSPEIVVFEVRRPWPKTGHRIGHGRWRFKGSFWTVAGRGIYWPPLITVWHIEPGDRDSGTVCKHSDHWKHPHHWRLQVHPLQHFRRWALTRCEWCGGRSRKGDRVNHSLEWDLERGSWWQGERGLFHEDCTSIYTAHTACICEDGIYGNELDGWGYGMCAKCGKRREWRSKNQRDAPIDATRRLLATIPAGERDRDKMAEVHRMWRDHRASKDQCDTIPT